VNPRSSFDREKKATDFCSSIAVLITFSVISVFSVVKAFNHRGHRGLRDTTNESNDVESRSGSNAPHRSHRDEECSFAWTVITAVFGCGLGSRILVVAAGIISLCSLLVASAKPKQPRVSRAAAVLTICHAVFWVWTALLLFALGSLAH